MRRDGKVGWGLGFEFLWELLDVVGIAVGTQPHVGLAEWISVPEEVGSRVEGLVVALVTDSVQIGRTAAIVGGIVPPSSVVEHPRALAHCLVSHIEGSEGGSRLGEIPSGPSIVVLVLCALAVLSDVDSVSVLAVTDCEEVISTVRGLGWLVVRWATLQIHSHTEDGFSGEAVDGIESEPLILLISTDCPSVGVISECSIGRVVSDRVAHKSPSSSISSHIADDIDARIAWRVEIALVRGVDLVHSIGSDVVVESEIGAVTRWSVPVAVVSIISLLTLAVVRSNGVDADSVS